MIRENTECIGLYFNLYCVAEMNQSRYVHLDEEKSGAVVQTSTCSVLVMNVGQYYLFHSYMRPILQSSSAIPLLVCS